MKNILKLSVIVSSILLSSALSFGACLIGAPPSGQGSFAIQVQNNGWKGKLYVNLYNNTVDIYDSKGKVGQFGIKMIDSYCTNTSGYTYFKINGVGDGNTEVYLQRISSSQWRHYVLWYGQVYYKDISG